ncbi:MAG: 3-deoxy-D-manno-octulosonic acid kinase [Marinobacter sp.]
MLVVNPAYKDVTEDWFDPAHWGAHAQPVSAGGRGSAWFVTTDQGDMVLRQYRRGGMVARFSERSYLFTGWKNTRSYREFELLRVLHGQGLPVPEPVAATAQRSALCYRAAILIRRIPGAVPLPEVDNLDDESLWREVGRTIRRFHDAGLDHVDLNCDNILVAGGEVYLIDFDRCRYRGTAANRRASDDRNLSRLRRSVGKRLGKISEKQPLLWSRLMEGYDGA